MADPITKAVKGAAGELTEGAQGIVNLGKFDTSKLGGIRVTGTKNVANKIIERGSHSVIYTNRGQVFDWVFHHLRDSVRWGVEGFMLIILALYLFVNIPKFWIIAALLAGLGMYKLGRAKITRKRYQANRGFSVIAMATGVA